MMMEIKSLDEYNIAYKKSVETPELFWEEIARNFQWQKKWDKVLSWNFTSPNIKWFEGAKLNITENCLDRHVKTQPDKIAIIWESNDENIASEHITYKQLHERVCIMANVLKKHGAKKGDRICIYMPMIPQLTIAVLACARIGAIHSVVFAGFSANSLVDRITDATCNIVITSDGINRGGKQSSGRGFAKMPQCNKSVGGQLL
jgi:acetyl-CoA synthetase